MSSRTKSIILTIAILQLLLAAALFALPRVVEALPGRYLVRLQNHQLTSGVVELVTTPMPTALSAARSSEAVSVAQLPQIPGMDGESAGQVAAAATPTQAPPSPTAAVEVEPTAVATAAPPTPTPTFTPTPTLEPLPPRVELEGLTSIVQGFNNCGPANMTIVLNYYGDETTQEEAASYLKPNEEDRNVSPWQINDYVNEYTSLRSTAHAGGNLELLQRFIAAGFPVVIEKGYEPQNGSEGWYGHYLTVYGYDDEKEELYSRDTYLGPFDGRPRIDSYDEFMKWWQQFNYTFYVIYPPAKEAQISALLPDVLEDDFSMWQYTAELARQELEEDPDSAFTWFNLGVAQTWMGQVVTEGNERYYEEATQAFDRAREIGLPPRTLYYEHRPLMAYYRTGRINDVLELTGELLDTSGGQHVEEIYWYRGHALAAEGNLVAAKEAYEKALEVNPNFYYAQWSLDWVNEQIGG